MFSSHLEDQLLPCTFFSKAFISSNIGGYHFGFFNAALTDLVYTPRTIVIQRPYIQEKKSDRTQKFVLGIWLDKYVCLFSMQQEYLNQRDQKLVYMMGRRLEYLMLALDSGGQMVMYQEQAVAQAYFSLSTLLRALFVFL